MNNRLLTNAERCRRHLSDADDCGLCHGCPETIVHVLRDYPVAKEAWCGLLNIRSSDEFFQAQSEDWWKSNLRDHKKSCSFGFMCWILWKCWNERIFEGKSWASRAIIEKCNFWVRTCASSIESERLNMVNPNLRRREVNVSWRAAAGPAATLNSDGSIEHATGKASAGRVLRDCNGRVLDAFAINLGACSITRAELTGAVVGIRRAWDLGIRKLEVQVDSRCAVQLLLNEGSQVH
ncbi:Putative ribonuclease H protein At1g65750 [Linum perenne]